MNRKDEEATFEEASDVEQPKLKETLDSPAVEDLTAEEETADDWTDIEEEDPPAAEEPVMQKCEKSEECPHFPLTCKCEHPWYRHTHVET